MHYSDKYKHFNVKNKRLIDFYVFYRKIYNKTDCITMIS